MTSVDSVDIQMKFKNQKWIARAIGVENWEEVEKDNCDTYQNQFYAQSFEMLENRNQAEQCTLAQILLIR